jgi:hypothetical protein
VHLVTSSCRLTNRNCCAHLLIMLQVNVPSIMNINATYATAEAAKFLTAAMTKDDSITINTSTNSSSSSTGGSNSDSNITRRFQTRKHHITNCCGAPLALRLDNDPVVGASPLEVGVSLELVTSSSEGNASAALNSSMTTTTPGRASSSRNNSLGGSFSG